MLIATQFVGFGAGAEDVVAASIAYTDHVEDGTDTSNYTFSTRAIGTAASNRYVVAAIGIANSSPPTISSVTIGGVSATLVTQVTGTYERTAFYIAAVPTGTTATVVVNTSGSLRCNIGLWALYDLSSATATDTDSSTSSTGSVNLDISAGGVAIGFSNTFTSASARTFTWSNLTENFDVAYEGNNQSVSGASAAFATAQSGLTISSTPSAGVTSATHIFASFR